MIAELAARRQTTRRDATRRRTTVARLLPTVNVGRRLCGVQQNAIQLLQRKSEAHDTYAQLHILCSSVRENVHVQLIKKRRSQVEVNFVIRLRYKIF